MHRSGLRTDVDPSQPLSTYYDLTANLTHTSLAGTAHAESQWRTHVHLRAPRDEHGNLVGGVKDEDEKWFEVQDLRVEEIEREMVALGETYVQVRAGLSYVEAAILRSATRLSERNIALDRWNRVR